MEDELDALFKLPLGEFTPARNALAARHKKAGQQAIADAVKAVPKPSVAAWVVNQLYWRHRERFDRLIEAGDRFRQAHSAQQTGNSAAVRERLEARREEQAALVRIAADVLRDGGYGDTRDMLRRVTTTLEALSTYGSLPDAPRAGRLTAELEPPGFDTVAALLPLSSETRGEAAKTPPAAARPFGTERAPKQAHRKDAPDAALRRADEERRRLVAAAKAAVRQAESALRAARTQVERTAATRETAAARAKENERRRADIEKQLAKVVTEADAARERMHEAEANAQQAAQATESAERALEMARGRLEQLAIKED
jgi:hypothetical protein